MRLLAIPAIAFLCVTIINAQDKSSSLDTYLQTGKTIVIAKCLSVGPINILLKADVKIQILHVVKGKETIREITIVSQYLMIPGKRYLLRSENEAARDRDYFSVETIDSAITISHHEDIEVLKKLSPRYIVLRTMDLRVDSLENEIRRQNYELEALKKARREN